VILMPPPVMPGPPISSAAGDSVGILLVLMFLLSMR